MEACFADGTGKFGSTCLIRHVEHPITLAKLLAERMNHAYIAGFGAEEYALRFGLQLVPEDYFDTDFRRIQVRKAKQTSTAATMTLDHGGSSSTAAAGGGSSSEPLSDVQQAIRMLSKKLGESGGPGPLQTINFPPSSSHTPATSPEKSFEGGGGSGQRTSAVPLSEGDRVSVAQLPPGLEDLENRKFGTVGAVAIDKYGHVAAATSTGGLNNKPVGRIGDSSILGHSTWANDETVAISCTGMGEIFMANCVAHDLHARVKYSEANLAEAADVVLGEVLPPMCGGFVGIDAKNRLLVLKFNTSGMFRGFATESHRQVKIWTEED